MAKKQNSEAFQREQKKILARELDTLEREIKAFQIDFQRFFAGDLPLPPMEKGERIVDELRRLRGSRIRGVAERYRLSSLEARFNSYRELFSRREREQERKRRRPPEPQPDAAEGVLVGSGGHRLAAEVLYKGLYLSNGKRSPSMDLDRFRSYLGKQAEAVKAKTGCSNVMFRVAVEDGKMKLKAKPVR